MSGANLAGCFRGKPSLNSVELMLMLSPTALTRKLSLRELDPA